MVLDPADAARVRHADDQGQLDPAPRPVPHLGDVADDLLEGRVRERVELHLDHGPHAVHGQADSEPRDARLRERRVEAAVLAELCREPVGDPEDAAERPDVLAEHEHRRVLGQGVAQGPVDRLRRTERLGRHGGGGRSGGGGHRPAS
nr:hypothetical protein GCM10025730_12490 [Promicromonospora thailandica]